MKLSYIHQIPSEFNKIPYVSLLVKKYNEKYTNSYMVREVKQKGKDQLQLIVPDESQVHVFYEEKSLTVEDLKNQIKIVELSIIETLEDLYANTQVTKINSELLVRKDHSELIND